MEDNAKKPLKGIENKIITLETRETKKSPKRCKKLETSKNSARNKIITLEIREQSQHIPLKSRSNSFQTTSRFTNLPLNVFRWQKNEKEED